MNRTSKIHVPDQVRASFNGELLSPGDAGYDDTRRVHNGMIDKRPGLIARCLTTADVVDAVNLGREQGLEVAVRGGGHNVAGKAVTDGGLMIDLSLMKGVCVDPEARTARAAAGTTWAEFNRTTGVFGLATTGGAVSSTGVTGLTLGGGLGYLMGAFGLAADNVLRAEVVTAPGQVVTASAEENDGLFWALRGGGGNFGVVTSLEFRLHRVGTVLGGMVVHPFGRAPDLLAHYREFTAVACDEVGVHLGLVHAPDGSGDKVVALPMCHASDDLSRAGADLEPVRRFGSPVADSVHAVNYPWVNTMIDGGFPPGALNYWKSVLLTDLTEAAAEVMLDAYTQVPSPMSGIIVEHLHGAVTAVEPTATAFPHRQHGYSVLVLAQWANPAHTDANVTWARETAAALAPHATAGHYVNYLSDDEARRVRDAYCINWPRLVEAKRRYDPDNLFRLNHNIDPTVH